MKKYVLPFLCTCLLNLYSMQFGNPSNQTIDNKKKLILYGVVTAGLLLSGCYTLYNIKKNSHYNNMPEIVKKLWLDNEFCSVLVFNEINCSILFGGYVTYNKITTDEQNNKINIMKMQNHELHDKIDFIVKSNDERDKEFQSYIQENNLNRNTLSNKIDFIIQSNNKRDNSLLAFGVLPEGRVKLVSVVEQACRKSVVPIQGVSEVLGGGCPARSKIPQSSMILEESFNESINLRVETRELEKHSQGNNYEIEKQYYETDSLLNEIDQEYIAIQDNLNKSFEDEEVSDFGSEEA